jgi:hypothetical protein
MRSALLPRIIFPDVAVIASLRVAISHIIICCCLYIDSHCLYSGMGQWYSDTFAMDPNCSSAMLITTEGAAQTLQFLSDLF